MTNIQDTLKALSKKYSSVSIAGEDPLPSEFISTGNLALDLAVGGKGIALGYAVEWSGFSGSGKTLLIQKMLAAFQRKYEDGIAIWVDRENAWFNKRTEDLGIDNNRVILFKPVDVPTITTCTEALVDTLQAITGKVIKRAKKAKKSKEPEPEDGVEEIKQPVKAEISPLFVGIDSISAFMKGGEINTVDMGKKAQEMHELFRQILPFLHNKVSMHFANQKTFKIGVMWGDNTTVTGGEGPKYYTTYRIQLDDKRQIVDESKGKEVVGHWIGAEIIKTRVGPNYRKVLFPYYYVGDIPYYGGYVRMLADKNYVKPHNKQEFLSCKSNIVKYKDKVRLNEFEAEKLLEEFPELKFESWPEYNIAGNDSEEGEE